jgi:hypothetical protein
MMPSDLRIRAPFWRSVRWTLTALVAVCLTYWAPLPMTCQAASPEDQTPVQEKPEPAGRKTVLFDGKSLKGWQILDKVDFDRHGEVRVEDGEMILEAGLFMTGVRWQGEFPTMDYEVRFEARRRDGYDFFCGMTFPVADAHCSLILGGWGGMLTGISSIDGFDASENETTGTIEFENKKWYKVRLRVTKEKLEAWVHDGEREHKVVDIEHTDRQLSVRWEMDTMPPFGFATYSTAGGFRNIVLIQH